MTAGYKQHGRRHWSVVLLLPYLPPLLPHSQYKNTHAPRHRKVTGTSARSRVQRRAVRLRGEGWEGMVHGETGRAVAGPGLIWRFVHCLSCTEYQHMLCDGRRRRVGGNRGRVGKVGRSGEGVKSLERCCLGGFERLAVKIVWLGGAREVHMVPKVR